MRRFADPNTCPECGSPLGSPTCGRCGLRLEGPLAQGLLTTLTRADELLAALRAESRGPAAAPPATQGMQVGPAVVPAAPAAGGRGVPTASVPQVLLGLGALCLLVAAMVFLAVTWSALGVAGRTAVLVALTAAAAAATRLAARRGLRGAAEALGLVGLGLLVLDVLGAASAGWLGDPSAPSLIVVVGAVLLAAGLTAAVRLQRTAAGRFLGGEAAAVLGGLLVPAGIVSDSWASAPVRCTVALTVSAALAAAVDRRHGARLRGVVVGLVVPILLVWLTLLLSGLAQLGSSPTTASVWLELDGWPLLLVAVTAAAAGAIRRRPVPGRVTAPVTGRVMAWGAAGVATAVLLLAPAADESGLRALGPVLALGLVTAAALVRVPRPWGAAAAPAAVLTGALALTWALPRLAVAAERYGDVAQRGWSGSPGGRLPATPPGVAVDPWLLAVCVAVVAAQVAAALTWVGLPARIRRLGVAAAGGLGVVATALLLPLPVGVVLAPLLVAGLAAGAAAARVHRPAAALVSAVLLATALPLSWYDEWLTLSAAAVLAATAAVLHLRGHGGIVTAVAGAVLAPAAAGVVLSAGAAVGAGLPVTAAAAILVVAGLVVAGLVVAGLVVPGLVVAGVATRTPAAARAVPGRRTVSAVEPLELGALLAAWAVGVVGVGAADPADQAGWAAIYLTLAGAATTAVALLRRDRREAGWLGAVLLASASWVRLADLGVAAPEPYTLPSAAALLLVGLRRLRRDPAARSRVLTPGLALALVPTLLWVLVDPISVRAVLLGVACLGLILAGLRLRWSALLMAGALAGAVLVLRESAPVVGQAVPRWVLIGGAGALLIGLGVTWEQRVREVRSVGAQLRALR